MKNIEPGAACAVPAPGKRPGPKPHTLPKPCKLPPGVAERESDDERMKMKSLTVRFRASREWYIRDVARRLGIPTTFVLQMAVEMMVVNYEEAESLLLPPLPDGPWAWTATEQGKKILEAIRRAFRRQEGIEV